MKTILGPFHPYLEDALVDELLRFKAEDALCPILVLLPSDALRRRVKTHIAKERQISLLNVQFLTFDQIALRLVTDTAFSAVAEPKSELFFVELLRNLIRRSAPGSAGFAAVAERAGGCAAVWQTVRDLRDAALDPEVALEALEEGHFTEALSRRTSELLKLLDAFHLFCAEKQIYHTSDLTRAAVQIAADSNYLKQFKQIFFYGFYDLTQIQIELFEVVTKTRPTMLLFPLLSSIPLHPAWSFAARFYERYLQGRSDSVQHLPARGPAASIPSGFRMFDQFSNREYQELPKNFSCTILNTFGIHDEISAVAKEILRIVDAGIDRSEIGVVARTLEDYGSLIKEIFAANQIPVSGEFEEPLVQFPMAKAVSRILNLPAEEYMRSQVIDLLSSGYFRFDTLGLDADDVRPDLWDAATRELAICSGAAEWERLERYTAHGLALSQRVLDEEASPPVIPASQIRALIAIIRNLRHDLNALPGRSSWTEYAEHWRKLLTKYLAVPGATARAEGEAESAVQERILLLLEEVSALDLVLPEVSLAEFTETFQRWLEQSSVTLWDKNYSGVTVANATTARGLKFRVLFIVGMNEGVFPRVIREDAFLRDRDREIIERDLGYKLSQKLAAFDEEKLIFTLLVNSATERLYCSFQRSDENGRMLAPSWYLAELTRACGKDRLIERVIPRGIVEKAEAEPFDQDSLLLPDELAVRLILSGGAADTLISDAKLSPVLYFHGVRAMKRLDRSTDRLGAFDGIIEPPVQFWAQFLNRGVSPTALELYATCPYQFFARQVLSLERLEWPEEDAGPSFAQTGELGHAILRLTYEKLIERRYFEPDARRDDFDSILREAANIAFSEYAAMNPTGYPLVWETLCETVTDLVRTILVKDLAELALSGYIPLAVELDAAMPLPDDWQESLAHLPIRGRMDRIDFDPHRNRLRIVDYKFKSGSSSTSKETDLYRAALRAERLQPPLYTYLARSRKPDVAQEQVETSFYYIAPRWSDGPLVVKSFNGAELIAERGAAIRATLAQLAEGIRSGRFFMHRGEHCRFCEISEICRKNHPPSLWRAESDPEGARHRALRQKHSSI